MNVSDEGQKKKIRILIVDDQDEMRDLYSTIIRRIDNSNIDILQTNNAVDAITIIKGYKPDLLIEDIELRQDLDGWHVIREVRNFDNNIKILIISAYVYDGIEDQALLNQYRVRGMKKGMSPGKFKDLVERALFDENFFNTGDIEERIIKQKLYIKQLLHDVKDKLSAIHANCAVSSIKFTTDDYAKKFPEKASKEAIDVLDLVTNQLAKMVQTINETDVK